MGLKYLKLCNFKSYKDLTEIPFNDFRFMGIIGPNGSGKSNILDAICFVMGMQPHLLRSNDGSDFRTIGTNSNEESFVEVGVDAKDRETVFKRTSNSFLVNGQEVSESEYIAKWKELNILPNGQNSVVLQGAVDTLAKGSPTDLAKLIESTSPNQVDTIEFEDLKQQIELAAQENQHQLKSRNAAQAQLDKMKEAKQAKRKLQEAKDKLQSLEARREILASKEKQAMISGLKKQVEDARELLKQATLESGSLTDDTSHLRTDYARKRKALQVAKLNEKEINEAIFQLTTQIKPLERRQANLEQSLAALQPEIEFVESKHSEHTDEKLKLEKSISLVSKAFELERKTAAQKTEQSIQPEVKQLWVDLNEQFKTQHSEAEAKLTRLKSELNVAKSAKNSANEDLDAKISDLETAKSELERILLKQQQESVLTEGIEQQRRELRSELKSTADEITELRQFQQESAQKLKDLTALVRKADVDKRVLNAKHKLLDAIERLKRNNSGVYDTLGNLVEPIDSEYQVALHVALGSNLDAVVVKDNQTVFKCIDQARKESIGRFGFLPLEDLQTFDLSSARAQLARLEYNHNAKLLVDCTKIESRYRPALLFALGDTVYVNSTKEAMGLRAQGCKMRIMTGSGINYSRNNILSFSSDRVKVGSQTDRKVVNAQRKAHQLAGQLKSAAVDEQELKERETRINERVAALDDKLRNSELEKEIISEQLNSINRNIQHLEITMQNSRSTLETKQQDYTKAEQKYEEFQSEISGLRTEFFAEFCAKVDGSLAEWDRLLTGDLEKEQEFKYELRNLETKLADYSTKCDSTANYLQRLTTKQRLINEAIELINEELEKFSSEMNAETVKLERTQARLRSLQAEVDAKSDEVGAADIAVDEAKQRVLDAEVEEHKRLLALTAELGVNSEELDLEPQQPAKRKRRSSNRSSTIDRDILSLDKLDRQITLTRTEIERLEPLVALANTVSTQTQESDETDSQRVDKMMVEIDRARKEYDVLISSFASIKRSRTSNFRDTLAQVELELNNCYTEFVGSEGKAQLVVVDESEPFSGVNFVVMPPGKSYTDISQLSGGERTMASLALLLACQKLAPAPFIVLDEVDAALDFANVASLAEYLKNHCLETQFIVVSLRQRLFQHSSNLIGVYQLENKSNLLTVSL